MAKDWSTYRSEIEGLYVTQGKSLEEVRRVLKGRHSFDASIRAYRMKFEAWGIKKKRASSRNIHQPRPPRSPATTQSLLDPDLRALFEAPTMDLSIVESPTTGLPIHRDLFEIIESGAGEEFKEALSAGALIHVQDHLNNYPLHTVVLKENVGMVEALLQYGANVDAIGQHGKTALQMAVKFTAIIPILLTAQPNFSLQDDDGNMILHHMLLIPEWWNDLIVIKAIELILSSGVDINSQNRLARSPLHLLITGAVPKSLGYMKTVSAFSNSSADVTTLMRNGQNLFTVFLERTDILLQNKEKPYEDEDWVRAGFRCLEQFLTKDADPNIYIRTQRLVHYCLNHCTFRKGKPSENFLVLLVQKADLDLVLNGNYILHMVLGIVNTIPKGQNHSKWEFPSRSVVSALIARKVNVNQLNTVGASPLEIWINTNSYLRAWSLYTQVILLLCEAGAAAMMTTVRGNSLFDELKYGKSKSTMGLVEDMLKADIQFQKENNGNDTAAVSECRQAWRSACKQSNWYLAKAQLEKLEGAAFRRPKEKHFLLVTYSVIAGRLLKMNRAELTRWLNGEVTRDSVKINYEEYGAILRDCGNRIAVNISYWKFLADIMHFYR